VNAVILVLIFTSSITSKNSNTFYISISLPSSCFAVKPNQNVPVNKQLKIRQNMGTPKSA
jgi:hypothetical protein